MESEPAVKREPADDREDLRHMLAETEVLTDVQTSIESDAVEIKQEPSEDDLRIKTEPAEDSVDEQLAQTTTRKRSQVESQMSSPTITKKQKLSRTVIDLTEDDLIAEAWDMAKVASPAPQAESLARLESNQHRELKKLEIGLNPQWYTPDSFFSRPASGSENDTTGQSDQNGSWSYGQVSHPAVRESDASGYRRSERRVAKYMSEAYGSSGIGKSNTQRKSAATVGRKLLERNLQKGIAKGQAQIVNGFDQDNLILDYGRLCICKKIGRGLAICCDGDSCEHKWYHLECVNLTEAPEGEWYCLPCRIARSNKVNRPGHSNVSNPEAGQGPDQSDHRLAHDYEDEQGQTAATPPRQKAPTAKRTTTPSATRGGKRLRVNNRPRPATRARSATPSRSSTTTAGPMSAPMSLSIRTRLSTLSENDRGKTM